MGQASSTQKHFLLGDEGSLQTLRRIEKWKGPQNGAVKGRACQLVAKARLGLGVLGKLFSSLCLTGWDTYVHLPSFGDPAHKQGSFSLLRQALRSGSGHRNRA